MSASDWLASLTSLPRRIIGSLGPTKRDLAPTGSHTFYEPATEKELIRNWVGWLAEAVGLPSGYAAGSLQGRLDALEGTTGEYRFDDFFDQNASVPNPTYWTKSANAVLSTVPRGGLKLPLDTSEYIDRGLYLWNREQRPRVFYSAELNGTPEGAGFYPLIWFLDSGGTNAWGVGFNASNQIVAFVKTGGSGVETVLGSWVAGVEVAISVEVLADGHIWISVDGGDPEDCGPAPAGNMTFRAQTHVGGAAGKFLIVRLLRHRATW